MQRYDSFTANSMAFRRPAYPAQRCDFQQGFHPIQHEHHTVFPERVPDRFESRARCSSMSCSKQQQQAQVEDDKFRQLPCRTFVASGACPYRDRCVYLHDPRIAAKNAKSKTRKKNKEELHNTDSFFWPIMQNPTPKAGVMQHYTFPRDMRQYDEFCTTSELHDDAVFSMWNHFVAFCELNDNASSMGLPNLAAHKLRDITYLRNQCTGRPRLPVFIVLSNGAAFARNTHIVPEISASSSIDEDDIPRISTSLVIELPSTPQRAFFPTHTQLLYQEKNRDICSPVSVITNADVSPLRPSFKKIVPSLDLSRIAYQGQYKSHDYTFQGMINPFVLANMEAAMQY